jgi:glycosyltransferase involved in cell wall biosynthesis
VPLYQRLARRTDLTMKVFFTWHAARAPIEDWGFKRLVAWDIPLTDGYEYELVPNVSSDPGTHHFFGLRNPSLAKQVIEWDPDVVHITGWAWLSHLKALRTFSRRGLATLFRGDSHLLDTRQRGLRWWTKRALLRRVFSWPNGFLVTGTSNRAYYEAFDVKTDRLFPCVHSIDVGRFVGAGDSFDQEVARLREQLGIDHDKWVLLFAGKFERKKRPLELMWAVQHLGNPKVVLVMVGNGELEAEVKALALENPTSFRILPFQNQSRMPVVFRLGDIFVLPSAYGETWGIAVNEALACGRPVIVSDRVGCAADLVDRSCGWVFPWHDPSALVNTLKEALADPNRLSEMGQNAMKRAWSFNITQTENSLMDSITRVCCR